MPSSCLDRSTSEAMPTSSANPLPYGRGSVSVDALKARIPEEEFRMEVSRSGGPGGQNVNKVNTRVSMTFDVATCRSLSDDEKARLRAKLGSRISTEGILRVTSSRHRTQKQNRDAAVERLYELIAGALARQRPRHRTAVPRSQRRRRLEDKRSKSEKKTQRRGGWRE